MASRTSSLYLHNLLLLLKNGLISNLHDLLCTTWSAYDGALTNHFSHQSMTKYYAAALYHTILHNSQLCYVIVVIVDHR